MQTLWNVWYVSKKRGKKNFILVAFAPFVFAPLFLNHQKKNIFFFYFFFLDSPQERCLSTETTLWMAHPRVGRLFDVISASSFLPFYLMMCAGEVRHFHLWCSLCLRGAMHISNKILMNKRWSCVHGRHSHPVSLLLYSGSYVAFREAIVC